MPRNNKILLRLTNEEYDKIKKKAENIGMKISCYIRFIVLSSKVVVQRKDNDN